MTDKRMMQSTTTIELPEKAYFKIGEVAKLLDVEPYVLRYWETEFDELEPEKTKSGQRVYQRSDIEVLFQIRTLLYEEMFTIAGARRQLERARTGEVSFFDLAEPDRPQVDGSAVAGEAELLEELNETRRELTQAQTKLLDLREEIELTERRAEEAEGAMQLAREELQRTQAKSEEIDTELVEELQEEVTQLQEALVKLRSDAESDRVSLRKGYADRDQRRRSMLSALRREVESLALLADPGRNCV